MAWKSVCLTYFFWFIGGWFGLHQLYLGRDRHAFLIWSTAGGYWGNTFNVHFDYFMVLILSVELF